MASAMARFLYTLRDTDAAPAATNGHDRATLAHAHEFSDRTATTRSCSQDRNTHRAWRNAETTARTNKHHDRRDNCATNNTTIAETTAQQTTPRSQRQLRNKQHHDRRDNCGTNMQQAANKHAAQPAANKQPTPTVAETTAEQTTPRSQRKLQNKRHPCCWHRSSNTRHAYTQDADTAIRTTQRESL